MSNVFRSSGSAVGAGFEAVEETAYLARDTVRVTRRLVNAYGENIAVEAEHDCELQTLKFKLEHEEELERLREELEAKRRAKAKPKAKA